MNQLFAITTFVSLISLSVLTKGAEQRPNIVVILADDLGFGDLACYGHSRFKTPNLDRMAREGAKLTQFNCPTAVCAPTRASLMTGRYPFRCGMPLNPSPDGGPEADELHLPESEITLPQLLKLAGYATGMIGKWHLGHAKMEWLPTHRGFDEYLGIPYSNDMRPVQLLEGDRPVEYPVVQSTLTQRYTSAALSFIERNKSRPFFLYFAHMLVHKPLAASEEFYRQSGSGLYGDTVSELDWSVGQVLKKLKDSQLDNNTLVFFTSDNGAWFGGSTGGLRGMKGSTYEGGYRVPCIARWPTRIPAGHISVQPAVMMDLFATTLAAAAITAPKDIVLDGRDIMPLLTSNAPSPHDAIFGMLGPQLFTVRDERWKLHVIAPKDRFLQLDRPGQIWIDPRTPDGVTILAPIEQPQPTAHPGLRFGDAPTSMQLFDLTVDPGEQHDVAGANPDVVARLKLAYDRMNEDAAKRSSQPSLNAK